MNKKQNQSGSSSQSEQQKQQFQQQKQQQQQQQQQQSDSSRRQEKRHSFWAKSGGLAKGLIRPEFGSGTDLTQSNKLWQLMAEYMSNEKTEIMKQIVDHIEHTLAKTRFDFTSFHCYQATALSVKDRLIESFNDTAQQFIINDLKIIYYLSLEYLIGRCLQNALVNLGLEGRFSEALLELGYHLEAIYDEEYDPALGNGGLGRLAACFLDSLATLNYPAWGYGIRYSYGIFRQYIQNGYQCEAPDFWLDKGNPWEIERVDLNFNIKFFGNVKKVWENNREISHWENAEIILARAYDTPIPGYHTWNTISLRLWRSMPRAEFDFSSFNQGQYFTALEERQQAETITSVLYPNDNNYAGKELRLKQQYLLVSGTVQDAIRRFMKKKPRDWKEWPDKCALQLNDTHPALAIVELLRILIDIEQFDVELAWELVYKSFSYTNHTVLPEALEKWGVDLLGKLLPRHLELIYLINFIFLQKVAKSYPGDFEKMSRMSIIEESNPKKVRMANLCIIGSKIVNGVAELHSDLLKSSLFKDFYDMRPTKFQNKTNGVTPRRWILQCNPKLAAWYTEKFNGEEEEWILNMERLKELKKYVTDKKEQERFMKIKRENKERLFHYVQDVLKIDLNLNSLFDVHIKRLHEYKRQLMNILYVIHRYLSIIKTAPEERKKKFTARTIIFAGKSAPGYITAKRIIKLINAVGEKVNNDPAVGDLLKVIFIPNYNVSLAQIIVPATDLSQHISTAGLEASGTSNMKFVMNGAPLIGTMDGANVEIVQEVGIENEFIFGAKVEEVDYIRNKMRNSSPSEYLGPILIEVINAVVNGMFGAQEELTQLMNTIRYNNDYYILCYDFYQYVKAQQQVDECYKNQSEWAKKCMYNAICTGKFSSDRTIREYAKDIWKIEPFEIKISTETKETLPLIKSKDPKEPEFQQQQKK